MFIRHVCESNEQKNKFVLNDNQNDAAQRRRHGRAVSASRIVQTTKFGMQLWKNWLIIEKMRIKMV